MRTQPLWKIVLLTFLAGMGGAATATYGYLTLRDHRALVATFPQIIDALNKHEAALQKLTGGPVAAPAPPAPQ